MSQKSSVIEKLSTENSAKLNEAELPVKVNLSALVNNYFSRPQRVSYTFYTLRSWHILFSGTLWRVFVARFRRLNVTILFSP